MHQTFIGVQPRLKVALIICIAHSLNIFVTQSHPNLIVPLSDPATAAPVPHVFSRQFCTVIDLSGVCQVACTKLAEI